MKFLALTTVVALAMAIPAFAQTVADLPQCAQGPILDAFSSSGCQLTDVKCFCEAKTSIASLVAKLPTVCNPSELQITTDFANKLCLASGVTLSLTNPAASSTTAPTSASTAAPAVTTSAASGSPRSNETTTSASTRAPSATSAGSASTSSEAAGSGAEASVKKVGMGAFVGALALGLAAL
ncbi:hypothetical protein BJ875DRAFT_481349 [Amylocarpus encephaloides]|uniref:CFEM domain-containing protein n=1 Tax=Amylocarpus encephaloides TaxID=45428 RepID=A0A9P7YQI6_9HELO|nr:hypothetical protein BJ875DRAFT_481349 [Amylocarpus encephaloides]